MGGTPFATRITHNARPRVLETFVFGALVAVVDTLVYYLEVSTLGSTTGAVLPWPSWSRPRPASWWCRSCILSSRGCSAAPRARCRPRDPAVVILGVPEHHRAAARAGSFLLPPHPLLRASLPEYLDFRSPAGRDREAEYLAALRTEIRALAAGLGPLELETVFVGGGTPSFVNPTGLAGFLDEVRAGFRIAPGAEVTLEANPSSTSEARAMAWLEAGFNRVSLGVQSLEPDVLAFLGRVHDRARALTAVAEVRGAGFTRISCDLIYAVPGLDDARWRATLEEITALDTGHVSAYELTVEPGTPLHASVRRGERPAVDPEAALRQHGMVVAAMAAAGLDQYEVSNFACPGEECRHNLVYWRRGHYLAAGLGAHGHIPAALAGSLGDPHSPGGAGRAQPADLPRRVPRRVRRVARWRAGRRSTKPRRRVERVLLGLRLTEGLPLADAWAERADPLVGARLLWRRGGRVSAPPPGARRCSTRWCAGWWRDLWRCAPSLRLAGLWSSVTRAPSAMPRHDERVTVSRRGFRSRAPLPQDCVNHAPYPWLSRSSARARNCGDGADAGRALPEHRARHGGVEGEGGARPAPLPARRRGTALGLRVGRWRAGAGSGEPWGRPSARI